MTIRSFKNASKGSVNPTSSLPPICIRSNRSIHRNISPPSTNTYKSEGNRCRSSASYTSLKRKWFSRKSAASRLTSSARWWMTLSAGTYRLSRSKSCCRSSSRKSCQGRRCTRSRGGLWTTHWRGSPASGPSITEVPHSISLSHLIGPVKVL